MKKFQYKITTHPAEKFDRVHFFCTETAECKLDDVPANQIEILEEILNAEGREGWDLVQLSFGKEGLLAFWKKKAS